MADTVSQAGGSVALASPRAASGAGGWRLHVDGSIVFIYALVLLVGIGAGLYSERFRDPGNLTNVLRQTIVLGLLAIGQSLVILAGGIDMSIALIARVSTLIVAVQFGGNDSLILPLMALGLCIGALLGLVNGLIITRVYASPFIVTFGMFSILNGIALAISSSPVGKIPPPTSRCTTRAWARCRSASWAWVCYGPAPGC